MRKTKTIILLFFLIILVLIKVYYHPNIENKNKILTINSQNNQGINGFSPINRIGETFNISK